VFVNTIVRSAPTTYQSQNFIEMGTFAGILSEPLLKLDPKIFEDPQKHHIRDGVWTKINPIYRRKYFTDSINASIKSGRQAFTKARKEIQLKLGNHYLVFASPRSLKISCIIYRSNLYCYNNVAFSKMCYRG